jgi:hypothetical protein
VMRKVGWNYFSTLPASGRSESFGWMLKNLLCLA